MDLCLKQAGKKPIFLPSLSTCPAVQFICLNLKCKPLKIVIIC